MFLTNSAGKTDPNTVSAKKSMHEDVANDIGSIKVVIHLRELLRMRKGNNL